MDTCSTSNMPMLTCTTTQGLSSQHIPTLTYGLTHQHTLKPIHHTYILAANISQPMPCLFPGDLKSTDLYQSSLVRCED